MAQPIDYLGMLPQVDLGQSLLSGLQAGAAFRQVRDKANEQERAEALAAQYSSDLQAAMANPTAQNFSALALKYPDQGKEIRANFGLLSKDQQDSEFRAGAQVYTALRNNQPEIANQVIDEQIAAMENAGQDASELKSIRGIIQRDPKSATGYVGAIMSSIDPERWGKLATEQRAATAEPFELSEKASRAEKAAVDARFAESQAAQDLQKGGWEIQKLANDIDISRQNAQIAALNANINREQNDLKRQELQLKLEDKQAKRDQDLRSKVAAVETSRSVIDNSLSTIDNILKNPALNDVLGAVEGSKFYPSTLVGLVPGTASADERQNALADIDTLKSQTFMTQLQQLKEASATGASGLGGVTEKEVDLLINGVQSLNTKQGEEKFKKNLQRMQELLLNGRSRLSEKYGVPDVIPDRPNLESQPASSGFRVIGVE